MLASKRRLFAFVLALLLHPAAAGAQDPAYQLSIADSSGPVGLQAVVAVRLHSEASYIDSFQFSICDDELSEVDFTRVDLGASLDESLLDSFALTFGEDHWTAAATIGPLGVLNEGLTHELFVVRYDLFDIGESLLSFCDVLEPLLHTGSGDVEPAAFDGTIDISESRLYIAGDVNGDGQVVPLQDAARMFAWAFGSDDRPIPCIAAADINGNGSVSSLGDPLMLLNWGFNDGVIPPGTGPYTCAIFDPLGPFTCNEVPIECPSDPPTLDVDDGVTLAFGLIRDKYLSGEEFTLPVRLHVDSGTLHGIQFGVCHGGLLSLADAGYDTTTMEFDFFSVNSAGGGETVGVLPSFFGVGTEFDIQAGELELFQATYSIDDSGSTTISFCCDLGDPVVTCLGLRDLEAIEPVLGPPIVIHSVSELTEGMFFTAARGSTGGHADVGVVFSNTELAANSLQGWSFAVCDDDLVSIEEGSVYLAESLAEVPFATHSIEYFDGGWRVSALIDLSGPSVDLPLQFLGYGARYDLGDTPGTAVLAYCEETSWVVDGADYSLRSFTGSIEIELRDPFTFHGDAPVTAYDPAAVPDAISIAVELSIAEAPQNVGFPTPLEGFDMAIGHDPAVLSVAGGEPAGAVAALDPEFVSLELAGGTASTISVLFGDTTLAFEDETAVFRLDYELTASGLASLAGNVVGFETELAWRSANAVLTESGSIGAAGIDVSLEFIADGVPRFLRGDSNGDGSVHGIADGIFLLSYGFLGGNDPPCFDAADVDDSGSLSPIADAVFLLGWSYAGGDDPPAPGPDRCGADPTDDALGCLEPIMSCD